MKPIRIRASSLPALRKKPATKYGNRPTGGHASRKEHKRAILLRLWERTGKISDLREQVSFELTPKGYAQKNISSNANSCSGFTASASMKSEQPQFAIKPNIIN